MTQTAGSNPESCGAALPQLRRKSSLSSFAQVFNFLDYQILIR
jgi:hypothetical protein